MLPLTPPKLGRYEIVDEIGKGAMGVVYLARDPLIGRLVALKTFRIGYSVKDMELEQFRIRFMREAQSAGILSHPNIVTIHDVVEQTEEGLAFIAMEYVRGTNLKAVLQSDQPLSLGAVVDIVSQVADALDYAHTHRVIHRDIKPANLLITGDNRVKITDFGIARLDTSNLTQEGQLLGTPNYMAPEQIQGKEVDHRADLFALGVVLYEMLTRHKPFQGENLTVVSHRIVYDHFTPPKEYARNLPPGIERVLDRALEKDPARRYQRARDMVEDLRRVLAETSREDLNETLSIASWVEAGSPGLPPTPPPPGSGMTTAASPAGMATPPMGTPLPQIPPAPQAAAAKPAPKPRTPQSRRRLALAAMGAALFAILAAAAVLLGISWSGGSVPPVEPTENAQVVRYVNLVQHGEGLLRQGRLQDAVRAFQQAQAIAPEAEKKRIGLMIQAAFEDQGGLGANEAEIAAYLAQATTALQESRYQEAIVNADLVLAVDPAHVEANRIRGEAQKEIARLEQQRLARATPGRPRLPTSGEPPVATSTPPPVESRPTPEETTSTVATGPARLNLVVHAMVPGVTVRIDIGDTRIFSQNFKARRTGIRRRLEAINASESVDLLAGSRELQVLVVLDGEAGKVFTKSRTFAAGQTYRLDISVSPDGQVEVTLS